MNDILDDQNLEKTKGRLGKVSAYLFLATVLFLGFSFFVKMMETKNGFSSDSNYLGIISSLAILGSILSCLIGIFFAIISVVKKEKTKMKIIGLIGNGFFFLLYISFIAYISGLFKG